MGSEADQKVDAYTEQAVRGLWCARKQAAFHVKTNSCWKHSENAAESYEFTDKKKKKKRTLGTVMDENQGWILSGESGH